MKYKIAICFCFFLILAPFIGSYLTDDKLGTFATNFIPYLYFGVSNVGGLPFADAITSIFGLLLMVIHGIGLILYIFSNNIEKRNNMLDLKSI